MLLVIQPNLQGKKTTEFPATITNTLTKITLNFVEIKMTTIVCISMQCNGSLTFHCFRLKNNKK